MRRRKTPKPINRRVTFKLSGRRVTVNDRITLRQATRECGEQRWFTSGDVHAFTRRCGPVVVRFEYRAVQSLIDPVQSITRVGTCDAVAVVRAGIPL